MDHTGNQIKFLPHHEQRSLCTTRPPYRQGRKLTAVKVYTVNDESVHLLIHGVPSIGLLSEVSMLCERYGRVKSVKLVDQYSPEQEEFTNVYHVQFERIQSARFAKKIIDTKSFFGGILHVCYAPELETIQETKLKLVNRKREIAKRTRNLPSFGEDVKNHELHHIAENNSFNAGYADKSSLESHKASNSLSSLAAAHLCFPPPSITIGSDSQESPIFLPQIQSSTQVTMPSSNLGSMYQQFPLLEGSASESSSKNLIETTPLVIPAMPSTSRKRPGSYSDSHSNSICKSGSSTGLSSASLGSKKNYIPTKIKRTAPISLKQSHSDGCYSQPPGHQSSSPLQAPQSSASHLSKQDVNNVNASKRPAVTPIKFLPRSVLMKKPKK
ncbi:unnamed protein product [Bemisia tabaci]|uniref:RNA-binding protein 48 n=1 Tax=Bemisia tabaci TaxID=7038 RepID=A0A9P0ADE8_BEMTA|nr:unnamed protein product [Bemisia tabaci]